MIKLGKATKNEIYHVIKHFSCVIFFAFGCQQESQYTGCKNLQSSSRPTGYLPYGYKISRVQYFADLKNLL